MANPQSLKLTPILSTRDGTSTTKDARITNLLTEQVGEEIHFLKRPGFQIYDGASWTPLTALGAIPVAGNTVLSFAGNISNGPVAATVQNTLPVYGTMATWDPAAKSARISLSGSNLIATTDTFNTMENVTGTQFKSSGRWYCEIAFGTGIATQLIGISPATDSIADGQTPGFTAGSQGAYTLTNSGAKTHGGSQVGAYLSAWTTQVMSVLFDATSGTITFWRAGVSGGIAYTGITGAYRIIAAANGNGTTSAITLNTGSSAFTYTPPGGYTGWGV